MMNHSVKRVTALLCALLLALFPLSATASPVGGGQASPSSTIQSYGCDMSFWNVGGYYPDYSRMNFEKMKADGCEFVILRVGFEGTGSRQNTLDDAFLNLYAQAKQAGMDVGVYFYALATTYEGAAEDAAWCIDLFEQYDLSFEYPIYYDVEDPGNGADRPGHDALTSEELTQLCLGWAQTLEAAGYYPGLYSGYDNIIKLKPAYTANYDIWYAYVAYVDGIPEFIPEEQDHSAFCGMWQYSWKGVYDGVVGDLDVNVAYKDYPLLIKTNGYNNFEPTWGSSLSVMPDYSGMTLYSYNDRGEGIVPTYHPNGTITLSNGVSDTAWSWPSAHMACRILVDIRRHPLLTVQKSGTAHFNAVLHYITPNGSVASLNLAQLDHAANGEFDSGEMTITVNIQAALQSQGHYPADGILSVSGITYFIMGSENTSVTLQSATFTAPPIPAFLTSPHYEIDEHFVAGVTASLTVADLLLGFENANGVVVKDKHGTPLSHDGHVTSGMTVVIEHDGEILKSYILSVLGDVNDDGAVSTMDARLVLGALTTTDTLSDYQNRSADFDRSGSLTTADVRDLLLAVVM